MCKTLQEFIFERRTEQIALSVLLEDVGQTASGDLDGRPNGPNKRIWLASSALNLETMRDEDLA